MFISLAYDCILNICVGFYVPLSKAKRNKAFLPIGACVSVYSFVCTEVKYLMNAGQNSRNLSEINHRVFINTLINIGVNPVQNGSHSKVSFPNTVLQGVSYNLSWLQLRGILSI